MNEAAPGKGLPTHGNQLTRKCCEPNGTSVTRSVSPVEATGLIGGSKAWVPRQPMVQSGIFFAFAIKLTEYLR